MQTDFYAANLKQWTVQVQSSADLDRRSVSDSFLESAFDDVWAIGVAECDLYINAAARFLCENANDLSIFSEKQAAVVEDVDPALSRSEHGPPGVTRDRGTVRIDREEFVGSGRSGV